MSTKMIILLPLSLLLFGLLACQASPTPEALPTEDPYAALDRQAFLANDRIGRAINLGNALDGPSEGSWGLYLKDVYFSDIAAAGFDTVRVPIRWSKYAGLYPPYEIQTGILERVDWVIEQAFANDLNVIINIHHYDAIFQLPETEVDRFVSIWHQLAERYQEYPDSLYFELLNEPHEKLEAEIWNQIFPQALAVIRETNPERYVIIGPDQWNSVERLNTLRLPSDDRRIIVTFHYYSPHEFTHQGASWSSASEQKDVIWGSEADRQALADTFDRALEWSQSESRPLFIGEFGVYAGVPEEIRAIWLAAVRQEAEARGFSWAHWDFGTDFAVYNLSSQTWRTVILEALIPPTE
ncbi:MAG: glycoside hydrolase family 5 protein [Anaerolineales bacterium]|nr:glycoside hydrolase family 5 protein [Anaerolineales bacterium]